MPAEPHVLPSLEPRTLQTSDLYNDHEYPELTFSDLDDLPEGSSWVVVSTMERGAFGAAVCTRDARYLLSRVDSDERELLDALSAYGAAKGIGSAQDVLREFLDKWAR